MAVKRRKRIQTSKDPRGAISYVAFRSSIELEPYRHAQVEAGAQTNGEDPDDALDRLSLFVRARLVQAKMEYDQMKAVTSSTRIRPSVGRSNFPD